MSKGIVRRFWSLWSIAALATVLAAVYWLLIASDRYVSEARIVIQRTDLPSGGTTGELGALLGTIDTGARTDQLLLRDYLLSFDVLEKLEAKLSLRKHYSDTRRDPLSRMWSENSQQEWFHRHYLSRVEIEYDEYSGVLVIKSQAYDRKMAQAITTTLVQEGESFMNLMAQKLAQEQLAFLDKHVAVLSKRVTDTRQVVLNYQNAKGLLSPQGTAENLAAIVNRLEAQLVDLKTRRSALLAYLVPNSPGIVELNQQIAAVEKQMSNEKARLASLSGKTLNLAVEEFQRLQTQAEFAQAVHTTALGALERGRVEATRTLKKVSVLQNPTEPQYSLEPRRTYNITVFAISVFLGAGVLHLLAAIVRDHRD